MANPNRSNSRNNNGTAAPTAPKTDDKPSAAEVAEVLVNTVPTAPAVPEGFTATTDENGNTVLVPVVKPAEPTAPPVATPPVNPAEPTAPAVNPLAAKLAGLTGTDAKEAKPKQKRTLADMLSAVKAGGGKNEYPVTLSSGKVLSAAAVCRWLGHWSYPTGKTNAKGDAVLLRVTVRDAALCLAHLAGLPGNAKLTELSESTVKTQHNRGRSGDGEVPTLTDEETTEVLSGWLNNQ